MRLRDARLLFVDDDPSAIHAMRKLLADCPNQRFATSGVEALRIAQADRPDLIVLDANMPGMTGLEVCDALKADAALADVPVIMATALDLTELEVQALQRGAVDFVTKPLQPDQFRSRIQARLRERSQTAHDARADAQTPADLPRRDSSAPCLLIVDDDVAAIHILRHTLKKLGAVHFATTGDAALHMARQLRPDLVLLDAHMPGIDGFAVCASLKAEPALRHVPVVFVTRYADAVHETRALDVGAADFISKPYAPTVLRARVRNLLELKRRIDADVQAAEVRWRRLADARVAQIVSTASDAILSCDQEHGVLLANAAAGALFGRDVADIVGGPLSSLISEPIPLLNRARQAPVRFIVSRPDGQAVAVEMTASSLEDADVSLTTLVLREVGNRERLEAETRARAAAEASSQAKSRMMAWLAHEMGNPLHAMLGFSRLMQTDTDTPLSVTQRGRLAHVEASARSLGQLLRDLLQMAQSECEVLQAELQPVDATSCAVEAIHAVSANAALAGVSLGWTSAEPAPMVLADARRLHQCLINLLSNAIKYNRAGGSVAVEIAPQAGRVRLAVRDDGIGMNEQQLESLFEPFNRLGRQHGEASGTGLGLVITRQLVWAMEGELQVHSSAGKGSRFTILLPQAITCDRA